MAFLVTATVFEAQAEPRVEISETVKDFGQVREDQALNHTFTVKNTGTQDLQVIEVDPDCACTAANYDRVIPPGGTGKISCEIKPFSVVHAFKKNNLVRFNASNQPSVNLVLKGQAQRSIDIEPSHIVRFRGGPKENLTARVRFTSHLPFPWEIVKFQNSIPDKIDVTLKTERPGKVYVVEVKNKYQEEGHYAGMIEIFTNSIQKPKIVMRVIADLNQGMPVAP
jgi:hypothetical protein